MGTILLFHMSLDNVLQEIKGVAGEAAPVANMLIQIEKVPRQKLLQQHLIILQYN